MKITIYVKKENYSFLKKLMNSKQVSLSTICDVVLEKTLETCKEDLKEFNKLKDKYIYKTNETKKTTIKISDKTNIVIKLPNYKEDLSCLISNLINLYAENEIDHRLNVKAKQKIGNELAKRQEIYWNLNAVIRQQKRALKILGVKKEK